MINNIINRRNLENEAFVNFIYNSFKNCKTAISLSKKKKSKTSTLQTT